jgi:hypothetical protein
MKRIVATFGTLGVAAALGVGFAVPASAATPVVHACVGTTFSAGAHAPGPLGQLITTFAHDPFSKPGLGDGIQLLQAGEVGQDVVANTCNTPS